jgi:endoglucanase
MRGLALVRAVAAVGMVAVALGACSNTPDRGLHPDRRPVDFAPLRHPFRNARLFMDGDTEAARFQRAQGAAWLDPITSHPQAHWLNGPQDLADVPALASQARAQGSLLVLVAYDIPNRNCSQGKLGARGDQDYQRFIDQLVGALGSTRAAIILEPDAVPADCFDARRAALLNRTVQRLAAAGQYVYLDAGHSRWRSTGQVAPRLLQSGIARAQGFSINVSNRQTTDESYRWGRELSDLLGGGREFVIDTSRNGLGPPPDEPGRDDEWCNPRRQGLGQAPTTTALPARLAALLWIKPPGESDGICGGERTFGFSPTQARDLIANARSDSRGG